MRFPRSRRLLLAGLAAAVPVAAMAAPAAAAPTAIPETCSPTYVRSAELVRTVYGPAIEVQGVATHAGLTLRLVPDDVVFIQQPDYFPYSVLGCGDHSGPITKVLYRKLFRVPTSPVGRYGIQIGPFPIGTTGL